MSGREIFMLILMTILDYFYLFLESPLLMENEGGVQEEVELLEQDKANF